MPIVEPARLFFKVLSNFCRDLTIGHLVDCLSADDASAQSFVRETFFEFSLCLTRSKEQDRFSVANMRDHLVIVFVQMARKLPVPLVLRQAFFRCGTARIPDMFLHA